MGANVMKEIEARAKADPQRVVLPEADEEKILQAAREVKDRGLALPVLAGEPDAIAAAAKATGVSIDDMTVVDVTFEAKIEQFAARFAEENQDYPARAVKRMLKNPLNFAAMMVRFDDADCMVAGLSHTTGEVIMAAQMIVGMTGDISTPSSMGILAIPGYEGPEGNLLAIADCAVCAAPGATELADIAISTADTVRRLLGWEPRVALLSFSTKGSASHERVDMVLEALRLVRERRPQLLIDGELQLDAAIVPEVAARKVREESPVAGKANVLIFPDLESGNIGVKLVQRFAGGTAYGPLLQGFAKPVSDLSRGAPVEEIVGAITMVAVSAQNTKGTVHHA
jgi:phosphate acetyltransferase